MDDLISRKAAIEACIEVSKQEEEYSKMWATGLRYAKRILTEVPSVPAVPLDKLCEYFSHNNLMLCEVCSSTIGYCKEKEVHNVCGTAERWKAILTKWMEGLDDNG